MRHLSFRSAAATISGKKKELTARDEAKYQLAFENEQRSKRAMEELQVAYDQAIVKHQALNQQKQHFTDVRFQYESLLQQIFADEDPAFPQEQQLRGELANYEEQRRMAKRDTNRFRNAEKALSEALVDIKKAIRITDTVVHYMPFEFFGGPAIDAQQIAYLEAAKRKIWQIQHHFNLTRTELPEIPYPQTLDVVTNNTLMTMQFNLHYVELAWKAKASQCFGVLATAYRNAQNSLTWVKQYKEYATGALVRLEEAIVNVKRSLEQERCRIVEDVLAGRPTTEASRSTAIPPPVYEAPPPMEASHHASSSSTDSMPQVPAHIMAPSPTYSHLPLMDTKSNPFLEDLEPTQPSSSSSSSSHPPQPIEPYISHNVNNPFNNKQA
ncbi:hypothetical protein EDC96DRAFT_532995 [Choanephora cucurbitarum]|nr:hypothetical protein EDC96DRAFT_532995 [Choanephora cucurbitarum]